MSWELLVGAVVFVGVVYWIWNKRSGPSGGSGGVGGGGSNDGGNQNKK